MTLQTYHYIYLPLLYRIHLIFNQVIKERNHPLVDAVVVLSQATLRLAFSKFFI